MRRVVWIVCAAVTIASLGFWVDAQFHMRKIVGTVDNAYFLRLGTGPAAVNFYVAPGGPDTPRLQTVSFPYDRTIPVLPSNPWFVWPSYRQGIYHTDHGWNVPYWLIALPPAIYLLRLLRRRRLTRDRGFEVAVA